MATIDSTAIPDPVPEPGAGGSPGVAPAVQPLHRVFYWLLRRELWENRFIYLVPLIVAALFLVAFTLGAMRVPLSAFGFLDGALDLASKALMLTYVIITVIYCLGALHNERSDRSILFWKSLPVSDAATVVAKASFPIILLPLITFAIIALTQGITLLAGGAVLLARGVSGAALWSHSPLFAMWAAILYHLLTLHGLYWAPFYGWILLASSWARRAAFLWASLPIVAVLIIEKLVFNSSAFAHMLLSRLQGGPAAIPLPPFGAMAMRVPTLANVAAFVTSSGLWIGFAVCAVFLLAAARVRRYQGPI